jgi:hypothetical protein
MIALVGCGKDATGPDVIQVPDPITLQVLGTGTISNRYTAEVAVRGNVAYTTTWGARPLPGNMVYVWDVTQSAPVLVDSMQVSNASTLGDVQVSPDGNHLVVATEPTGSIVVFSLADPRHPVQISRFQSANTTAGVHTMKMSVINGRLYGFLQIDPGAGPARLTIVDMTDLLAIKEVFSQPMGAPYIHDVFVRDGYLFAALWNNGMAIYDVGGGGLGTPSNPRLMGGVTTPTGQIHNIWWFHDPSTGAKRYAFIGEEGPGTPGLSSSGNIHVIDVTDMAFPDEVATLQIAGAGTHNFWVDEQSGILYAAYYNAGVQAIDIRGDLGTCTDSQKTVIGNCDLTLMGRRVGQALNGGGFYIWGVQGSGNRLFASDMNNGLHVIDITPLKR